MDWLESVVGKEEGSGGDKEENKGWERREPLPLSEDEGLLADYSEVEKMLRGKPPEPPSMSQEELKEYGKFMDSVLHKESPGSSSSKRREKPKK